MKAISKQDNMPPAAENLPSAQPGPPAPEYRKVRTSTLPCHPAGTVPESNIPLDETQHARYRIFPPSGTLPCKEATNIFFCRQQEEPEMKKRKMKFAETADAYLLAGYLVLIASAPDASVWADPPSSSSSFSSPAACSSPGTSLPAASLTGRALVPKPCASPVLRQQQRFWRYVRILFSASGH